MKPILIYGIGDEAKCVSTMLNFPLKVSCLVDDIKSPMLIQHNYSKNIPMFKGDDFWNKYVNKFQNYFFSVPIGSPYSYRRKSIIDKLLNANLFPYSIIHKSTIIESTAKVGKGVIIHSGVKIGAGARIGNYCIINQNVSIDHGCVIEDYCELAPSVTLCGNVKISSHTWLCVNTAVGPNVTIPSNCIIGASSLILKDIIKSDSIYWGQPAKYVKPNNLNEK